MIFQGISPGIASASAWLPWLYDTVVIILVVYKSLVIRRELGKKIARTRADLFRAFIRDGLLYYSVIFAANCSLTIMIIRVSPGLKNLMAQFEVLITVTAMSRITISIRKDAIEAARRGDVSKSKLPTFRPALDNVVPPVPARHRHHLHPKPHRAPGKTTFGSNSAHASTYVPAHPPSLPHSVSLHRNTISFGSDAAHAVTYVPHSSTGWQIGRDSFTNSEPANETSLPIGARRDAQFRHISRPSTPGTHTRARTPLSQTVIRSFAELTPTVTGPDPAQQGTEESGEQSMHLQPSVDAKDIELESIKCEGVIEHVERV